MQYLTKPIFRVLRPVPLAFFSQKKDLKLKDIDERQITSSSLQGIIIQRRRQGRLARRQEEKDQSLQEIFDNYDNNLMDFMLYMRHDCERSQLIFALMNYNNLGFKKVSNIVFLEEVTWQFKKQLRSKKDAERWPMLKAQSSLYPADVLIGEDKIMDWMTQNHFFKPMLGNIDWQEQAIQFIKKSIQRPLEVLFYNPVLTAQASFDGDATSDRRIGQSTILLKVIRYNAQKLFLNVFKNSYKLLKNKEQYQKSKQNLLLGMNQWINLLKNNEFCGGKSPNIADFYLYAVLRAKWKSRHFRNFIENKTPKPFVAWFRRMGSLCQFNPQRLTIL